MSSELPIRIADNDQLTSTAYLEDEVKLDASEPRLITDVWNSVLRRTRHFHPAYHNHRGEQKMDDIDWRSISQFKPVPPSRARELLTRYYYDTRNLALHNNAVELRIEAKGGLFKQVIKVGNGADMDQPMMRRGEYPGMLRKPKARTTLIDKKAEGHEETVKFLKKTVKGQGSIKPVNAIEGQRRRRSYHPDGDRDITIEFAADLGTGINIRGFIWQVMQIELEIKENRSSATNAEILLGERGYLTDQFADLEPSFVSKPYQGFRNLAEHKIGKKKWGKLPCDRFQLLKSAPV